jgi:transposase-like protein
MLWTLHQQGFAVPAAQRREFAPLPLEPPTLDLVPTSVEISGPLEEPSQLRAVEPLLEWQRRAIELYHRQETIANIAREVHKATRPVAKFLEAAVGYVPPWKPGKYSDEERERALAMASEQGEDGDAKYSVEYIANSVGVGTSTVHRWIEDSGGRRKAKVGGAKPRALRKKALAMYADGGLSESAIARELGLGKTTVRRWIEIEGATRSTRERALELWHKHGKLATEIAVELGVPDYTIRAWAEEAGLKRAPHHRPDVACKTLPEDRARRRESHRRKAAGLPPLRPPLSTYEPKREEARARCIAGESCDEIAAALGMPRGTVYRWIKNIERPSIVGAERWTSRTKERARALRMWQDDVPIPDIAGATGVTTSTIRAWAKAAGLARPDGRFGEKPHRRGKRVAGEKNTANLQQGRL